MEVEPSSPLAVDVTSVSETIQVDPYFEFTHMSEFKRDGLRIEFLQRIGHDKMTRLHHSAATLMAYVGARHFHMQHNRNIDARISWSCIKVHTAAR